MRGAARRGDTFESRGMFMGKERIYFMPLEDREDPSSIAAKAKRLFNACGAGNRFGKGDLVAVKTHFGEAGNTTYLRPVIVKALINKLKQAGTKPFLTETSTLYRGKRSNASDHLQLAQEHGFGPEKMGVPIVMADGLFGDAEVAVRINGRHFDTVSVARDITRVHGVLMLNHFKGHMITGIGGALKNLAMGLTSRRGKLRQHSTMTPGINRDACTGCGSCVRWCPQDAIEMVDDRALIHAESCIGCGECYAVCRFAAVNINFGRESSDLQEYVAEHAAGVVRAVQGEFRHFNFLINMTKNCDCMNGGDRVAQDIGILAGENPATVDKASLDLFERVAGKSFAQAAHPRIDPLVQVRHAASLGLGGLEYDLEEVVPA